MALFLQFLSPESLEGEPLARRGLRSSDHRGPITGPEEVEAAL